jgi:hypothetical protein
VNRGLTVCMFIHKISSSEQLPSDVASYERLAYFRSHCYEFSFALFVMFRKGLSNS